MECKLTGGADISVGRLHWQYSDPKPFLTGISNMLGSAKVVIVFVPEKLLVAVRLLIDSSYSENDKPFIVERRVAR